ncbi:endonuclease domain-containing 1 protein-like [Thunnus albacares]|uniref:endonuclease domain-containing 1 protein-like n=1 Tax=Thunnus albacares TaxID=8236 RepID=UPI001CF6B71B|nr:endonuclease domain-containing 1 protein-like [Thunnus albacares]
MCSSLLYCNTSANPILTKLKLPDLEICVQSAQIRLICAVIHMWGWFGLKFKPSLPSHKSQPVISKKELYIDNISFFIMKLLVSAFLLLALSYPATAEVVESFTGRCDNFFFKGQPPIGPTGDQYKKICQKKTQAGGYEYATLYDTSRRIPVYSAYKFQGQGNMRKTTWDIEPQLDDQNGVDFMASEGTVRNGLGRRQAVNEDYTGTARVYDKGHLLPVKHRNSQSCAVATFTLTNAAPQHKTFNRGTWRVKEAEVADTLTTDCLNRGFHAHIVTGVVPGNTNINRRVNIPRYFWSAYCCRDNNNRPKLSGAFYGKNDYTNRVTSISITSLDARLTRAYGTGFQVFSDKCSS